MNCRGLKYAEHAVIQMFKRNISVLEIEYVIKTGRIIKEYNDDKPYPSILLLGEISGKFIHVVIAINTNHDECIIITAYIPDSAIWNEDFTSKK